ncbi:lycopene cyclase domain-containing protein [Cumulibacter soli]|uniref:lycopene cyclase domain-containing protein n=1 Tax=Cumulibacter soli TaxID=2546344 RepID=UPI001068CB20|nr:lycopene cyclase domain-containing protein [Cumulibacter soli]
MTYTIGAIVAILAAVLFDAFVTRQRLTLRGRFWLAYAIILFFQLIMNGFLTGLPIVSYDPAVHWGPRIVYAPIEDIGFGFGLVLSVLSLWSKTGTSRPKQ